MKLLHEALESIHTIDDIAHLDVRIENTCFWRDEEEGKYHMKLIDFDRSEPCSEYGDVSPLYARSNMYMTHMGWTLGHLDFKQLGLLIGRIEDDSFDLENPLQADLKLALPLVTELVTRGQWNEQHFATWASQK